MLATVDFPLCHRFRKRCDIISGCSISVNFRKADVAARKFTYLGRPCIPIRQHVMLIQIMNQHPYSNV